MDGTAAPPGASALSSPAFRKYLCGNLVAYIGFRMQRDGPRAAYYALHHPAGPGDPAPNSDAGRGL